MTSAPLATDFGALHRLKSAAADASPETLREVARQFEAIFARMLLKNMRAASLGDGLFDSQQGKAYRDMFDQQLSMQMSAGRGLGIADVLVRQLGGGDGLSLKRPMAPPGAGTPDFRPASPTDFVRTLLPHARKAARSLGVAPQLLLAQAALETGWGKRPIRDADGKHSFNLFGIKATGGWSGARAVVDTLEFVGDLPAKTRAAFRGYNSLADAFADYAGLLTGSPRYRAAVGAGDDAEAFAQALTKGGYATDPDYATKLVDIVQGPTLRDALDATALQNQSALSGQVQPPAVDKR